MIGVPHRPLLPSLPTASPLWLRVDGSGCRVRGSGFRVQGSGFRVWDLEFRVELRVRGPYGSGSGDLCSAMVLPARVPHASRETCDSFLGVRTEKGLDSSNFECFAGGASLSAHGQSRRGGPRCNQIWIMISFKSFRS